ncbi:hypothetical protein ACHAXT_008898 [Thalassiosira profunda]
MPPLSASSLLAAAATLVSAGRGVEGFSSLSHSRTTALRGCTFTSQTRLQQQISANDNYYGGFDSSFIVREFSLYEQLEDIVQLASKPLPERPDGIVAVAKFTSAENKDCRATEASYERLARDNPATIFLRCFKEMEGADSLFQRAQAETLPCFDIFYKGNRVARVEGPRYNELETILGQYQILNSNLDLFSEEATASRPQASPWGQGGSSADMSATPRTTAAFIPGYDWNQKGGFFDELANDFQKNSPFDNSFEESYEDDWMPKID